MQMGPYAPGSRRAHPDQIVRAMSLLEEQAQREAQGGVPLSSVLREVALAGFLVGTGMAVNSAVELVRQWRLSGMSTELQRPGPGAPQMPQPAAPPPEGTVGMQGQQELLRSVEKALKDQATATVFYGELAERAQKEEAGETVVDYIRHAQEDEGKHFRMLKEFYKELAGTDYEVKPGKVEYNTLAEGLLKAMNDEYEAMEFYREIYLSTTNNRIRDLFFELMTDELEHATRFNYTLQVVETEAS